MIHRYTYIRIVYVSRNAELRGVKTKRSLKICNKVVASVALGYFGIARSVQHSHRDYCATYVEIESIAVIEAYFVWS